MPEVPPSGPRQAMPLGSILPQFAGAYGSANQKYANLDATSSSDKSAGRVVAGAYGSANQKYANLDATSSSDMSAGRVVAGAYGLANQKYANLDATSSSDMSSQSDMVWAYAAPVPMPDEKPRRKCFCGTAFGPKATFCVHCGAKRVPRMRRLTGETSSTGSSWSTECSDFTDTIPYIGSENIECAAERGSRFPPPAVFYLPDGVERAAPSSQTTLTPPSSRSSLTAPSPTQAVPRPRRLSAAERESRDVWRYCPEGRSLRIKTRQQPAIDSLMTKEVLAPGDEFEVSESFVASDGVRYLRLADGRGWLFDRKPGVGIMCVPANAGPLHHL